MEIKFDNLSSNNNCFSDVSFDLNNCFFAAINGCSFNTLYELLSYKKRPASGSLDVLGKEIKRSNHVEEYDKVLKKIGFVSELLFNQYNEYIVIDIFFKYIKDYKVRRIEDKNKHIVDSLKFVGLSKGILKKLFGELSYSEKKKVLLACVIAVNPKIVVLDDFDKGLIFRDKENFKKIFVKLKVKFDKQFLFVNTGSEFLMSIVDKIIVINKGKKVYDGDNDSFYDDKLYKYLDMPPIVSFTKQALNMGHDIICYSDTKELLKELYRKIK